MKLVPVEPTEAMINAAGREAFLNGAPEGLTANHVRAAYRAMLAASPTAREEAPAREGVLGVGSRTTIKEYLHTYEVEVIGIDGDTAWIKYLSNGERTSVLLHYLPPPRHEAPAELLSNPQELEAPAEGAEVVAQRLEAIARAFGGPDERSALAAGAAALRNRTSEPARESWASMAKWTEETFGPVSLERIATRANEEMQELLADPSDVMEAADVCIVLSRYPGIEDAINRKMAINRKREWRLNGDGSGYHVKTGEAAAALRDRTSEPEAGAVACPACLDTWGECNTCGGSHKKDPRWIAAHPAPATADKLKVAVEALEPFAKYPLAIRRDGSVAEGEHQLTGRTGPDGFRAITNADFVRARQALAALNEGGE